MEWKIFWTAFATLFVAELGDKTQLAVIAMTAKSNAILSVFLGASLALIIVTLLGALAGGILTAYVPVEWIQKIVAVIFVAVGVLMLIGKL